MDNVADKLEAINLTLEKQNAIAQELLNIFRKPENKFIKVLKIFVLIAGALAILNSADIIRIWLFGG
jgi:hypothetical protein